MASKIRSRDGTEFEFIALSGTVQKPGPVLEDLSRPGVNGTALRDLGMRGQPFELIGFRDFDDAFDADEFFAGLQAAARDTVILTDDFNMIYGSVALLSVMRIDQRKIASVVGGLSLAPTVLMTLRIIAQVVRV